MSATTPFAALLIAAAVVPADTTPERAGEGDLALAGSSVVEGAWAGGEPGLLQVVGVAVEPELAGGVTARLELLGKWGHDGLAFASSQGHSSFDADDFAGIGEAWLEWRGRDRLRVKAGWVDANSEFAASSSASEFANPSFGLSPAMAILPSYPSPAPSVNVFTGTWARGPDAGAAVYRSGDGAWSAVAQLSGAIGGRVPGSGPVRWSAGWAVPLGGAAEEPPVDGWGPAVPAPAGSAPAIPGPRAGGFLILERPAAGVSPFVLMAAAGRAELLHLAGGFTAPVPDAPLDARLGLAGSMVRADGSGHETVAELFLSVRPLRWLVVQPDVQLRFARGAAPTPAGLVRIVVER